MVICIPFANSHYNKPGPEFLVTYEKGPAWLESLDYKKQKGIPEHVWYLKEQYKKGKVQFAGVRSPQQRKLVVFKGYTREELQKVLDGDPGIMSKALSFQVEEIQTTMIKKVDHTH